MAANSIKPGSAVVQSDHRGDPVWGGNHQRLDHPNLAIRDEDTVIRRGAACINVKEGRLGYNPYESGLVSKKPQDRPRKKDLRALSKWIKMDKKLPNKS